MFIVVSPSSPEPMYRQVTDQIKDAIASGDLKAKEKLPSIREMARALDISVITVKRAYLDLENEGYIRAHHGLGSFVADVNMENLRAEKMGELEAQLTKIVRTGKTFGISKTDITRLLSQIEEK